MLSLYATRPFSCTVRVVCRHMCLYIFSDPVAPLLYASSISLSSLFFPIFFVVVFCLPLQTSSLALSPSFLYSTVHACVSIIFCYPLSSLLYASSISVLALYFVLFVTHHTRRRKKIFEKKTIKKTETKKNIIENKVVLNKKYFTHLSSRFQSQ